MNDTLKKIAPWAVSIVAVIVAVALGLKAPVSMPGNQPAQSVTKRDTVFVHDTTTIAGRSHRTETIIRDTVSRADSVALHAAIAERDSLNDALSAHGVETRSDIDTCITITSGDSVSVEMTIRGIYVAETGAWALTVIMENVVTTTVVHSPDQSDTWRWIERAVMLGAVVAERFIK